MSAQFLYYFQVASTLSVLLPLLTGFIKINECSTLVKCFIAFLLAGLITDLAGWYLYLSDNKDANRYFRHGYDLIEAVFLFLLIANASQNKLIARFFRSAVFLLFLFWLSRFFYYDSISIYKSTSQVFVAFGACYCILQLVEQSPAALQTKIFWILLGVFFYCFSTFFVMGILVSKLAKVWYAHSIVNIITNIIYFIGLVKSDRLTPRTPA